LPNYCAQDLGPARCPGSQQINKKNPNSSRGSSQLSSSYRICEINTNSLDRNHLPNLARANPLRLTFICYSIIFFQQAGLPTIESFNLSMAQYSLGVVGAFGSWFLIGKAGRRPFYLYGSCVVFGIITIIGLTSLAPSSNRASRRAIGSMLLLFTFIYNVTVGPVCYSLVSEISSTRLRAKTIVLARNVYNIGGILVNCVEHLPVDG
jgi:hypothetical protein